MSVASLEQFQKDHARLIERLYADVRADRWQLSAGDFAAALHRSAVARFSSESEPTELDRYLSSLCLEDLALAAACEQGTPDAWMDFLGRFRPVLYGAALALAHEESRAREITDTLYADLYGLEERDGKRRSLFQYFHGRSSLSTWLRSVVARTFVDGYRADQRSHALKERLAKEIPPVAAAPAPVDPDRMRHLTLLKESLTAALARRAPRDRLRLGLYYVQQLTLAEVGRVLDEHESTVSRRLEEARRAIRTEVERALREQRLGPDDIQACYELALDTGCFDLTGSLTVDA